MAKLYTQTTASKSAAIVEKQYTGAFTYRGFSTLADTAGLSKPTSYKLYDMELVKRDLLNHFYIRRGEKLENPRFGTIIWDLLFEQMTERVKSQIQSDVQTIINYDPRMKMDSIAIVELENGIRIDISLTYIPFNKSEKLSIGFDKKARTLR